MLFVGLVFAAALVGWVLIVASECLGVDSVRPSVLWAAWAARFPGRLSGAGFDPNEAARLNGSWG